VVANNRFAVAVHAATTLAYRQARGAEYVSSEELAASVRRNPVVVRRIIRSLARAGVVTTKGRNKALVLESFDALFKERPPHVRRDVSAMSTSRYPIPPS
jgi:DNA-binding transcriptional regulator YhcF (GntR family)